MYFMDAVRLLVRRWYVAVVGLLLIVGGAAYTTTSVPTQYQASGELLFLLPPDSTGGKTPSNPYINLVPGLTTTASMIATEAMTKDTAAAFAKQGFKSEYSVALVPSTGPLLTISSTDTDPEKAVAMRNRVMKWLNDRLDQRQQAVDVPPSQTIYTEESNVGQDAEVLPGNKIRALAGVAGAGGILTLLIAFVLDRLLSRRQVVGDLKVANLEAGTERTARSTAKGKEAREAREAREGRQGGQGRESRPGRESRNGRAYGEDGRVKARRGT